MAIFSKNVITSVYLPGAFIGMLKHGTKVKVLLNETTWFLIEVNRYFRFEVMIVFIISKIL